MNNEQALANDREYAEAIRHLRRRRIRRIAVWSFCVFAVVAIVVMKKGFHTKIQQAAKKRAAMAAATSTNTAAHQSSTFAKVGELMHRADKQLEAKQPAEAVKTLQEAVAMGPECLPARLHLAMQLAQQDRCLEAAEQYRAILHSNPDDAVALNNLADILASNPDGKLRDGTAAVELAQRAVSLTHRQNSLFLSTLAAAYAENGLLDRAVQTAREAVDLAAEQKMPRVGELIKQQLAIYERGQSLHQRAVVNLKYAMDTTAKTPLKSTEAASEAVLSPLRQQLQ